MGDVHHRPERKISESVWVKNTSIYATTEQNNQFSVSRNIDENHTIPSGTIRLIDYIVRTLAVRSMGIKASFSGYFS